MKCKRFKRGKGGRKVCASFGRKGTRRGRRRHMSGGLSGLHTIGGVKFHCTAYGRGPSRKLRCGTVSVGGGPPRNRPKSAKGKYRKRGRYKKRVRMV